MAIMKKMLILTHQDPVRKYGELINIFNIKIASMHATVF